MQSNAFKILARVLVSGVVIYALATHLSQIRAAASQRDSIAYWTAGQLLLHQHNPYDPASVFELEKQQGYREDRPLVLRTPPWSLFMVLPLGLLNPFWSWVTWLALSVGSLVLSMRLLWGIQGGSAASRDPFLLVGYTFAPVPACLVAGQMGLLLLLGVVLFLRFQEDRPYLAGVSLVLPFAKPHLLALFWLVFLAWIFAKRKYPIAIGFGCALAFAVVVAMAFDPSVFRDYREMLSQESVGALFIPAVSGVVRALFFHRLFWVQFVPVGLGVVWCAWFYAMNRLKWDWCDHGLAVMVVSVLVTPYSWLTDEVVLLPAILQTVAWIYQAQRAVRFGTRLVFILFGCLNALLLLILSFKIPFSTGIYFWSSLVWFAWYLNGRRFAKDCQRSAIAPS
jgi:hypothetical protein